MMEGAPTQRLVIGFIVTTGKALTVAIIELFEVVDVLTQVETLVTKQIT